MSLAFDPVEHRYFWQGQPVPGVTSVLQAAGLIDFTGVPIDALVAARERGTAVHRMCELDDLGDLDEDSADDSLLGYLVAWRKFREETGFAPDAIEQRVYHPTSRYAGTLDRMGMFQGHRTLIDLKTGAPQRATGAQLAGYAMAVDQKAGHKIHRFAIHLEEAGTFRLIRYAEAADFVVFNAALVLHNWRNAQ